eukprot:TRINITY_DN14310_c0_g1_i2.p1 TRINITY_DN14310_c0_g1~~TRINITY_DN14310_c0_g1_i2.p1  ORF type:complete len:172 (+),score=28.30 TRINITY_DN14310_c0_g1_i2:47-562(+)
MDVPELLVSDTTNGTEGVQPTLKKGASVHLKQKGYLSEAEKNLEELEWLQKSQTAPVFNKIIEDILKLKPANPIGFFWQELTRSEVTSAEDCSESYYADPRTKLKKIDDPEDDGYLRDKRLHAVFDDLIQQLLDNRPPNALTFALSWIRFNASRIVDAEEAILNSSGSSDR